MNDPDGSYRGRNLIQKLTQDEPDKPEPRRLCSAAGCVNRRRCIRA
jgi:hypothetical protein